MPKKIERSPLQELAEKADEALHLCWVRLGANQVTRAEIETMVRAWRVKRAAYEEQAEKRQQRKEERESDNDE